MTGVSKLKGIFLIRFAKFTVNITRASSLWLLIANLAMDAVSAQSCPDKSGQQRLEIALEAYSPTQRVGNGLTLSRDRQSNSQLVWALPTDFTEITHFAGEIHQLANHEGLDFIHLDPSVVQVPARSAAEGILVY